MIKLYYPGNSFPAISITGAKCSLKCKHCMGKCLETMIPATTPQKLKDVLLKIKNRGGDGALISGGADPYGSVPLKPFIGTLKWAKEKLEMKFNVHTGIVNFETAKLLSEAGIDMVSIDIIGSESTVQDVIGLKTGVKAYVKSLENLESAGIPYSPHIIIGLDQGKVKGEYNALKIISKFKPEKIVLLILMPLRGTPYHNVKPPSIEETEEILEATQEMFGSIELALGCMRPRRFIYEKLAIFLFLNVKNYSLFFTIHMPAL